MIYSPNGRVERVEAISGPQLLSSSLAGQMMDWTVKTDASGDELCQTLVIAKFTMLDSGQAAPEEPKVVAEPTVLRLSAEASPDPITYVIEDPAPLTGWRLFRARIRSTMHKIFVP
jgi:hypothetical protein